MDAIKIDHKTKTVSLEKVVLKNNLIYEYFSKIPVNKREELFKKALYIGVLALVEDRLSAFLAKTKNELGTELEYLKVLFDLKTEMFMKSAVKGKIAERELVTILNDYFDLREWKDYAILVGDNEGKYKNVKTGDILCFADGKEDEKIVIEVKFQKSLPLGDLSKRELKNNTNNIWGQLLEAKANRNSKQSIIVFDKTISPTLEAKLGPVSYIPNVGFISIIDTQAGDFQPLFASYNIARSVVLSDKTLVSQNALFKKIVEKVLYEIKNILSIKTMIQNNIKNNEKILNTLETALKDLELTDTYVAKFLEGESIDSEEFYKFFIGSK